MQKLGSKEIPVNPRIISAINVQPQEAIAKNQLRKDFYYRIAVVNLEIPPLRQRLQDIPVLIRHRFEPLELENKCVLTHPS
ncbi:MAG: sigma 54-interacting transcriptional regulator [Bacillota bacterium]